MREFGPYFDQEKPEVPILGKIADYDKSEPYELDAAAVFKTKTGYLIVEVSGCSCWPDRGGTTQTHHTRRADVDKHLINANLATLRDACQHAQWKVTQEAKND